MVEYLKSLEAEGKIDYLILSKRNIGKLNALKIIFNSAPGEIVALIGAVIVGAATIGAVRRSRKTPNF